MIQAIKNKIQYTVLLLLIAACSSEPENKRGLPSAEVIPVKTTKVQFSEEGKIISATGLISTENEANYAFKIGGVIDRIYVKEGQRFKKGQLLANLKVTEIESQVEQARFAMEKAERDHNRISNLYRDSVATLEQFQDTKTALDVARKGLESVSFNKKYAYIYASADGFITKKIANEGEVVNGGQPVLAINELGSKRSWVLKVGVADKEWAAIRLGSKASVVVDAFPGYTFPAVVSRKSQAADPLSGSFQVELKLEADRKDLAVGMFGKASIQLAYKLNRASIPYDAVIEANGKDAYVFVPASKTTVKKVPITIDSFDNTEVTISQGLEDIEEIVVSNSAFLNEKSTIKIVK